jgi:hypothetical protein
MNVLVIDIAGQSSEMLASGHEASRTCPSSSGDFALQDVSGAKLSRPCSVVAHKFA